MMLLVSAIFKMNYIFSLHHKSENTEDLKGDISFSKYRLSSPSSSKKKQLKEKDKKKLKGDPKKPSSRLHQERCVHCHELFSEVSYKLTLHMHMKK